MNNLQRLYNALTESEKAAEVARAAYANALGSAEARNAWLEAKQEVKRSLLAIRQQETSKAIESGFRIGNSNRAFTDYQRKNEE